MTTTVAVASVASAAIACHTDLVGSADGPAVSISSSCAWSTQAGYSQSPSASSTTTRSCLAVRLRVHSHCQMAVRLSIASAVILQNCPCPH